MREKLETKDTFTQIVEDSDVIGLLALVRTCGLDFSDKGYLVQNQVHVLRDLLTYKQGREVTNHNYRDGLDTRIQKLEQMGGNIAKIFKVKDPKYAECTRSEMRERILAVIAIDQACNERFGDFKKQRSEDAHLGRDDFPATRTRAAIAMDNHSNTVLKPKPKIGTDRDDSTPASSFFQLMGEAKCVVVDGKKCVPGKDGKLFPDIDCHNCGENGHYQANCPKRRKTRRKGARKKASAVTEEDDDKSGTEDEEDETLHNHHLWFNEDQNEEYGGEDGALCATTFANPKEPLHTCFASVRSFRKRLSGVPVPGQLLILLDTGANAPVFNNSALLTNIGPASDPIPVSTQAGNFMVDQVGIFPGYGPVYYHKEAIINVLSMGLLEEDSRFEVTHRPKCFTVKRAGSKRCLRFPLTNGIYVMKVDPGPLYSSYVNSNNENVNAYVLATVTTVAKNEAAHSRRDVTRAKAVLPLIQALGYPSRKDLKRMIRLKSIGNCPVTGADVDRFYEIYGGTEGAIKGKTARKTPLEVNVDEDVISVPREIAARLNDITISLDIFFVERMPFLTSISRKLMYTTTRALQNRLQHTVLKLLWKLLVFIMCTAKK